MIAPAATATAIEQAATYLRLLFGDKPDATHLLVWTLAGDRANATKVSAWFTSPDEAAQYAVAQADRANVYTGMAVVDQPRGPRLRYEHDHATAIAALWIDLDVDDGTAAHAEAALPSTRQDARGLLDVFPFPPTMVVDSGHGLQAYYCLREPWVFGDARDRLLARSLVDRFQATVIARADQHGWSIEGTSDLPRVLRVPGTLNRKTADPAPVTILEVDQDRRYDPSDVEPYLLDLALSRDAAGAATDSTEPPEIARPIGADVAAFIAQGAPDGLQRAAVMQLARAFWGGRKDIDEAVTAALLGIGNSVQRADDPWTEEAVADLVRDIYRRPPSTPFARNRRIKLGGRVIGAGGDAPRSPRTQRSAGIVVHGLRRPMFTRPAQIVRPTDTEPAQIIRPGTAA